MAKVKEYFGPRKNPVFCYADYDGLKGGFTGVVRKRRSQPSRYRKRKVVEETLKG